MAQLKTKEPQAAKPVLANSLKTLIVDDHKMIRDGIRTMLESHDEKFNFIVTEAEDGESAVDMVIHNDYDIVLMDYQLPKMNGAETTKNMRRYKSKIKILALSNYDEYTYITNIMRAGAKGYILKDISSDELVVAIDTILKGKNYYANDVAIKLIDFESPTEKKGKKKSITQREMQVLRLIASEMNNEQISKKLNIGRRTVDTHRQNLINKLDVKNTAGLIKKAYEMKVLVN